LVNANKFKPRVEAYEAGDPNPTSFGDVFDDLIDLIAERNPDFYEADGAGNLRPI
jgi:hypothetical protein